MISENEIIKGCVKGDRNAQKALYDMHASRLLAICRRYTKSMEEAEDILQESFIKIFRNMENYRGDSRLGYWMKRITINTALNHQRSKLYLFPMVDVQDLPISTDKDFTLKDFKYGDLLHFIESLPDGCQVIFNLYAIEGFTHREIGEMLDLSEGTSKSQYARAKQLLREMIEKENDISYGTL